MELFFAFFFTLNLPWTVINNCHINHPFASTGSLLHEIVFTLWVNRRYRTVRRIWRYMYILKIVFNVDFLKNLHSRKKLGPKIGENLQKNSWNFLWDRLRKVLVSKYGENSWRQFKNRIYSNFLLELFSSLHDISFLKLFLKSFFRFPQKFFPSLIFLRRTIALNFSSATLHSIKKKK